MPAAFQWVPGMHPIYSTWIIVRYGLRSYAAMSRAQYKRNLKRHA